MIVISPLSLGANNLVSSSIGEPDSNYPSWTNVVFATNFDGTNGSTSAVDLSSSPKSITISGTGSISTNQSKFGGASFNPGSTGRARVQASSDFTVGTAGTDYTLEFWAYLDGSQNTNDMVFVSNGHGSFVDGARGIGTLTDRKLRFYGNSSGYQEYCAATTTNSFPLNQWVHVAICRSGISTRLFQDGVQQGSTNTVGEYMDWSAGGLCIGGTSWGGATQTTGGFIDTVIFTRSAKYTSNFTPPTFAPTGEAPLWSATASYRMGDQVRRAETKKIYESLSATATVDATVPEISVYQTVPKWKEVGFINRYRMFDYTRNSSSTGSDTLTTNVSIPGRIDSVVLMGMSNVASITLDLVYSGGTYVIYTGSNSYVEDSVTKYYSTRTFFNIPPHLNGTLRLTLVAPGGTGTVGLTYFVTGFEEYIGSLQNGLTVDTTNYSNVTRDNFGNATLVRRRNVPKIAGSLLLDAKDVDRVAVLRNSLNATPAVWIGTPETSSTFYNSLIVMGFYKAFSFNLDNPLLVQANIEIEEI